MKTQFKLGDSIDMSKVKPKPKKEQIKMATIQSLASALSDALTHDKRNDGAEYVHLKDGSPSWMTEVIRSVHGDKLPDDTVYQLIEKCAEAIANSDEGSEQDAVSDLEADIYTNDLTAWLHARADHIYYLTQALEEFEAKEGCQALMIAQKIQIDEVGACLVSELEKIVDDQETEEEV
jgi:hypothetical protein